VRQVERILCVLDNVVPAVRTALHWLADDRWARTELLEAHVAERDKPSLFCAESTGSASGFGGLAVAVLKRLTGTGEVCRCKKLDGIEPQHGYR
jgi:hypothetical protein